MRLSKLAALPAATLLSVLLVSPAQAAYVCTGVAGPADPSTPYFNGDLTDSQCDITEIEAALSLSPGTIDESFIAGSKTNSNNDPISSWSQDEFGLGTLTVTTFTNTSGTWELAGATEPLFFVEKYDRGYDIYTYMGGDISPFSDSWDGAANRGTAGATCRVGGGGGGGNTVNCNATTSHISVYGVVPVPAAVWLFGSGLLGLVGIARRRRA